MRPRKRDDDDDDDEAASPKPSPLDIPPRASGGLNSMVVRPPESDGGGNAEPGAAGGRRESPPPPRRRDSPLGTRRRGSPRDLRRRDLLPNVRRSFSPPDGRRRGGSAAFRPRFQRFRQGPGSISPPQRQRLDDVHFDPEYDSFVGQHYSGGFRGGRGSEGFRDVSPQYGSGRGGKSLRRGYNVSGRGLTHLEGEYVHRNDPNLSPREGDWICQNPSCGNLNFARRAHCNKCNRDRYETELHRPSLGPRRGYLHSPPLGSSPGITGPVIDHAPLRDIDRYRSPRGWDVHDSRDIRPSLLPLGIGGWPVDHVRRERLDYREDLQHSGGSKFDLPVSWGSRDVGRDGFVSNRSYGQCAPSPHGGWIERERSLSPLGNRPMKRSYGGRGGQDDDRHYDSYLDHHRNDGSSRGHGRGYRQSDSVRGRGHGERRGMTRGRNKDMY